MEDKKVIISPKTKVGELLDTFPDLEPVLMAMSPAFEKLKNPVLRRTVARVATLQQVALVGSLNIDEMIRQLRKKAGQEYEESMEEAGRIYGEEKPDWLDESKINFMFDATPVINAGESPMAEILRRTSQLKQGEILGLRTPFTPAPIIDMLREKKFRTYTIVNKDVVVTYITR